MRAQDKSPVVILRFELPEHREELKMALNGSNYKIALEDMDEYFRKRLKYEELSTEVYEALEAARSYLREASGDYT